MGNETSYEMQDHVETNGKLQNGDLNGHIVSISLKEEINKTAVQQDSGLPTPPINKDTAPTAASEPDGLKAANSTPQVHPSPNKPDPPSFKAPENPSSELVNTEMPTEGQSSAEPPNAPDPEVEPKPAPEAKVPLFNKLFKKKTEEKGLKDVPTVQLEVSEGEKPVVMTVTIDGLQSAPGHTKERAATAKGPNGLSGTPVGSETPSTNGESVQAEETKDGKSLVAENPVMNFFKTFASPSKTSSEETSADNDKDVAKGPKEPEGQAKLEKGSPAKAAVPSATEPKDLEPNPKDSTGGAFSKLFRQKSFKDTQPTTTNGVQEVDAATAARTAKTVPPPEPPKAETKAEPAAKNTQKEVLKDMPSGPETSAKKLSKGGRFSKLFSSKPAEKEPVEEKEQEEVMEVEEEEGQTAASKASTLEATPPPEQPPKPMEKKKSNLISLFKTKAPEVTKDTPPEAPLLPEAAPSAKAKEEPKPPAEAEKKKSSKQEAAPKAKAPEVAADNKPVSEALPGGDDAVPSVIKKLEKRNSIHLFFKSLAPKRLSEVGVQTDPVTITYPSEKAK